MLLLLLLFCIQGSLFLSELINYTLYAFVEFIRHVKCCKLVHVEATLCLTEEHFVVKTTLLDLIVLILFKPFDTFAFLPETKFSRLSWHLVRSQSMLFPAAPVPRVDSPIDPCVDTVAMLLIVLVFTTILSSVLPCVYTDAIHVIIDPFSFKLTAVKPCVGAETSDFILLPFTVVP